MKKPAPGDFNLTEQRVEEMQQLERRLEANLPFVFGAVTYIGLAAFLWSRDGSVGGALIGALLLVLPFGMILHGMFHDLVEKRILGDYYQYRSAGKRWDEWFIRMQREFWWSLDGRGFEIEVAALLQRAGYQARLTPTSGDEGVDIVLADGTLVQCKAHKTPIAPGAVRELYGTLQHFKASKAILISKSGFTKGAEEFAHGKPLQLWDLPRLIDLQRRLGE